MQKYKVTYVRSSKCQKETAFIEKCFTKNPNRAIGSQQLGSFPLCRSIPAVAISSLLNILQAILHVSTVIFWDWPIWWNIILSSFRTENLTKPKIHTNCKNYANKMQNYTGTASYPKTEIKGKLEEVRAQLGVVGFGGGFWFLSTSQLLHKNKKQSFERVGKSWENISKFRLTITFLETSDYHCKAKNIKIKNQKRFISAFTKSCNSWCIN